MAQSNEEEDLESKGEEINPFIHPRSDLMVEILSGNLHSVIIKETLAGLAEEKDWLTLWEIADN